MARAMLTNAAILIIMNRDRERFLWGVSMKGATIKDIAVEAGISPSTVSRVINDNYPVSADVRRRVLDAIDKLQYRPNAIARSLRASQSYMIALVVADLSNYFFMEAAKGLEEEVAGGGYSLVIASSNGSPAKERTLVQSLAERRVDGMCVAPVDSDGAAINGVIAQGTRVVLMDRSIPDVHSSQVVWNDFETAKTLTGLLIAKGHRRIGMVNVTLTHTAGAGRLSGFQSALQDAQIRVPKDYISPSNFSEDEAYRFVRRLMERRQRPTALVCANNVMAEGALRALNALGLRVGEDVSLVSFGFLECNKYITPKITTAELDSRMMGRRAGRILLEQIAGGAVDVTQVEMKSTIAPGDSIRQL